MRLLFSLEGPYQGFTRRALASIAHDAVHVFSAGADPEDLERVQALATRAGARFRSESIPKDDLMAAFRTIHARLAEHAGSDEVSSLVFQVNAGKDANLASAAALLACLHEGVEARFLHEKGETELRVLSKAPLENLLTEEEVEELSRFPDEGLPVDQARARDAAALNRLKDRALIGLDDGVLRLSERGSSYREHLREREP